MQFTTFHTSIENSIKLFLVDSNIFCYEVIYNNSDKRCNKNWMTKIILNKKDKLNIYNFVNLAKLCRKSGLKDEFSSISIAYCNSTSSLFKRT